MELIGWVIIKHDTCGGSHFKLVKAFFINVYSFIDPYPILFFTMDLCGGVQAIKHKLSILDFVCLICSIFINNGGDINVIVGGNILKILQ